MNGWWNNTDPLIRFFFRAALFFSEFFVWQLISALMGLGADDFDADTDGDVGGDADHTYDHFEDGAHADAVETSVTFRLLSMRSIITFFTLFCWGSALYLQNGESLRRAMGLATAWGMAGMLSIALIFYAMKKMSETGNIKLSSCVGKSGSVYLDIPESGFGEIRITVSEVVSYIKARSKNGNALEANTPVKVVRQLGLNTVEVEKV